MTAEIDTVLDRRRLRRRLTIWRGLAIAALVGVVFALGASTGEWSEIGAKQIARVSITGTITEDRDQLEMLKKIADSDKAAALLVFVNSPGGTTTGGEALFGALRDVAKKKPVVAQFGTVAASAGYIVGLGADHIVTRANTITGSIGVLIQWPEVSQMLDKIGVKFNEIKSGDLKAVPSPFEPLSEEGQKVTKSMIDEGFRWFLGLVEARRGIKPDQIPGLTQGRVFTGREAVELKLADSIGGEDEAVAWLQSARNVDKGLKVVDWKPSSEASLGLFSSIGSAAASFFNHTYLAQMLGRAPSMAGLGLDGLISVWHPSEN
ncbi:protease IV [Hyphomicrobium sp. 1Nfss2.1]|uniref:signal peptide peptidase SppA n=1 Tax=Hyphomicrobium sp. 1Nfss2.1 TaxID=3413936 RepID=UPI003C7DCEF8